MKSNLILKKRTEGTMKAIYENLKNVSSESLITDLFVTVDSDSSLNLMKRFETILIKASIDKEFLNKNLHNLYCDITDYINEGNLYKEFIEFSYFIYSNLTNKKINISTVTAYQNLLLQQYCYLSNPGELICGLYNDGNLMRTSELYPFLDYAFYDIERKKSKKKGEIIKAFRKYGYEFETIDKFNHMMFDEMMITNMVLVMSKFINEDTLDLLPDKYFLPSSGFEKVREWKSTDIYRDLLKKRRYTLPSEGVVGVYKNAAFIKSILFKEVFVDDQIYLLYKVENDIGEGFYGVYDTKSDFFYSVFKDSTGEEYNRIIENFILENYCHLTTDIEIDRKRNIAIHIVDNIEENNHHYPEQPIVEFSISENKYTSKAQSNKKTRRKYDKVKYKEENIQVNPFIRSLPVGMVASQEAIERAKELGYFLLKNETFVRGFTRKNFTLKE